MDIHIRSISSGSQYMDLDKPNPLFIPEIVRLVFECVDPPLYRRLSEVCRLWRSVGHNLVWSYCSMDNRHLFKFLRRHLQHDQGAVDGKRLEKAKESEKTAVETEQDDNPASDESSFENNCHLIKVLKFSKKKDLPAAYFASLRLPDPSRIYKDLLYPSTIVRLCDCLRELHTLIVRPSLAISQDKAVLSKYFRVVMSIISRCSHFRTLDIRTSGSLLSSGMLHEIARNDTLGRIMLRELRLACDFEGNELLIFQHLIKGTLQMIPLEPFNSGNMTLVNQIKARNFFCPDLRTLYLHNIQPVTATRRRTPFFRLLSQDEPMEKLIPSLLSPSLTSTPAAASGASASSRSTGKPIIPSILS